MPALVETHVVTCFLRSGADVLLLQRSEEVGSYRGKWAAVSGHAEGDLDAGAVREIREETGIEDVELVCRGEPFEVHDAALEKRWIVHPYLFDVKRSEPELNWESSRAEWTSPTAILERDTVPELWTSYRRVAPTLESVRLDEKHGSAYLSLRAVEVLRDRAAEPSKRWGDLSSLANALVSCRPSMTALHHRVNRVMFKSREKRSADAVLKAADEVLADAVQADDKAAAGAASLITNQRVLTLSRSGTVLSALLQAQPDVVVAQSLPGGEGRSVAEQMAAAGLRVTMCADAGIAVAVDHVDVLLIGADTVLSDGTVVNKVGTRPAALAAKARGIPVVVVAASDKVATDDTIDIEPARRESLYDGDADIQLINPLFELTPADLVNHIVTDRGVINPSDAAAISEELRQLASWRSETQVTR